jgi:hypothetical protein
MNPGGQPSESGTPYSVSKLVKLETDEFMKLAKEEGFGTQKQNTLKVLVCTELLSYKTYFEILIMLLSS